MHVALTGATGFIGSNVARRLKEAGHEVTALARSTSRREHVEPWVDRFVTGEMADGNARAALLDGADCVIENAVDWAPLRSGDLRSHLRSNVTASIELLHAAAPRQFVYMSSVAVHHDMRPRWEGRVDEDHPTRPGGLYGAAKAAVEAHLWAAHFERGVHACALRPCAVYGVDPRLDRSIGFPIIERMRTERRFEKDGGGKFVHVDDVAAATVAAVGNPDANGAVYNLADCYARWTDLAVMAAELLGVEAAIEHTSPDRPRNVFTKDAARTLGVALDRGHDGLRAHLRALIAAMEAQVA